MKEYKIGDFAKHCNLSTRTLHYYDEIGLLQPIRINNENGYRYYNEDQMLTVNKIRVYRELGFSIEEIKALINEPNVPFKQQVMVQKEKDISEQIDKLLNKKRKLKHWVEILNDTITDEISVYEEPAFYFLYKRYIGGSSRQEYYKRFTELRVLMETYECMYDSDVIAIFYDDYRSFDPDHADIEVGIKILNQIENKHIRKVDSRFVVSTYHFGSYETMVTTYQKILDWCKQQQYHLCGPAEEEYIIDPLTSEDGNTYLTKITIPIKKS